MKRNEKLITGSEDIMQAQQAVKNWHGLTGSLMGYLSEVSKEVNSSSPWVEYLFEDSVVRIWEDGSKSYWRLNPL